jgi:hypothetical protein
MLQGLSIENSGFWRLPRKRRHVRLFATPSPAVTPSPQRDPAADHFWVGRDPQASKARTAIASRSKTSDTKGWLKRDSGGSVRPTVAISGFGQ